MKKTFYVNWATWTEGKIETPWDFWYFERVKIWRERSGTRVLQESDMSDAYMSINRGLLDDIEANFIQGVKLAAFIEGFVEDDIMADIKKIFPDALIDRCVAVTPEIKENITRLFVQTLTKK